MQYRTLESGHLGGGLTTAAAKGTGGGASFERTPRTRPMAESNPLTKPRLQASVRDLVEFSMRSGDLVNEYTGANRAAEAIRIHQKIQKSRPEGYRAEVPVTADFDNDAFVLTVSGRADGVFESAGTPGVEEIKTTTVDIDRLSEEQHPLHWGQLKCYGAMLGAQKGAESVDLQLTYASMDSGDIRIFERRVQVSELAEFLAGLVERYLQRAAAMIEWSRNRDLSITSLEFPFDSYRPGQREMAVAVYRNIRDSGQLLIQAATGIGKTMATLFPAIKAMADIPAGKIFYLTARTTGRMAAEKAMAELSGAGLLFKSLTLTAKDKICFEKERDCAPDECDFARGHFDRINAAVDDLFGSCAFTRQAIEATARRHRVCPFELSLEMSLLADCIICDYNYAFDPRVYLRRFFDGEPGQHIFLIDEAHNLVDRSRAMFSAELSKQTMLDVRRSLRDRLPNVYRQLGKINRWMLDARKMTESTGDRQPAALADSDGGTCRAEALPPEAILPLLRVFMRQADRWLAKNEKTGFRKPLLDLYFEVSAFMRIAELYGGNFATLYRTDGRDLSLKLYCIDPARHLAEGLNRSRSAVFFSATMSPLPYFRQLLGCSTEARFLDLPSPFPSRHFQVFIADGVSTLYRRREETKQRVADFLGAFVQRAAGNYLLFFPSYRYMQAVHALFRRRYPSIDTLDQQPGMTEQEREDFLRRFRSGNQNTLAGFAVMGGIFGEGIDLVGNRLSGAAVVGVGLPGICLERELIRTHFADTGFDYAYTYPGINRVLQAGGRVIRSEQDRGSLLLIDSRYATFRYRCLLPEHWQPNRVRSPESLLQGQPAPSVYAVKPHPGRRS